MKHARFAGIAAVIGGISLVGFGLLAVFAPRTFYDTVAAWPPYNHHFVHDIGAFQIGLGAVLLLALRFRDALFVALAGTGLGAAIHALVHVIDRDLGGKATDPIVMALLAALLLAGAATRWRETGTSGSRATASPTTAV